MGDHLSATEYRLLVEHSPVMIWRAALNAECDYFNDTWLQFTGRPLAKEMGNGWAEGVHPEDLDRCVKHYLDHFARREAFEMEYRLRRHDGVYRWIFDRGTPFYDDAGNFAGFIGSCVDVDNRRRAQSDRERKGEQQLASARDFEKWIVAIVSHDIRNPLNAIAGSASTLLEMTDLVKRREVSPEELVDAHLSQMERLDPQLHAFVMQFPSEARQGSGVPVARARTDLRSICRQVLDEFDAAAKDRALELRCEGEAVGDWDPHRLAQAISNLVGNAIEHSPPGSPIQVKIDARENTVVAEVHNEGHIPPEVLPEIFQPFKSGGERIGRSQGLGLGLFIAQAIAKAHRGHIEVASTAETGTSFRLELPRNSAGPT